MLKIPDCDYCRDKEVRHHHTCRHCYKYFENPRFGPEKRPYRIPFIIAVVIILIIIACLT